MPFWTALWACSHRAARVHSPHCLAMACAKLLIKDIRISSLAKIRTVYIRDVIIPKTHGMKSPGYIVHGTTFIMMLKKNENVFINKCDVYSMYYSYAIYLKYFCFPSIVK